MSAPKSGLQTRVVDVIALRMRSSGSTFVDIAAVLGVSKYAAGLRYQHALCRSCVGDRRLRMAKRWARIQDPDGLPAEMLRGTWIEE